MSWPSFVEACVASHAVCGQMYYISTDTDPEVQVLGFGLFFLIIGLYAVWNEFRLAVWGEDAELRIRDLTVTDVSFRGKTETGRFVRATVQRPSHRSPFSEARLRLGRKARATILPDNPRIVRFEGELSFWWDWALLVAGASYCIRRFIRKRLLCSPKELFETR